MGLSIPADRIRRTGGHYLEIYKGNVMVARIDTNEHQVKYPWGLHDQDYEDERMERQKRENTKPQVLEDYFGRSSGVPDKKSKEE